MYSHNTVVTLVLYTTIETSRRMRVANDYSNNNALFSTARSLKYNIILFILRFFNTRTSATVVSEPSLLPENTAQCCDVETSIRHYIPSVKKKYTKRLRENVKLYKRVSQLNGKKSKALGLKVSF